MKRLLPLLVLVPILLLSCDKDDEKQNNDGYASAGSLEKLEYNAITTGGCDVSKPDAGPMEMIMSVPPLSFAAGAIGVFILKNVGTTILSTLANKALNPVKEYFFGPDETTKAMNELADLAGQMEEKMLTLLDNAERTLEITDDIHYNIISSAYLDFQAKLDNLTKLNDLYSRRLTEDISEADLKELISEWGTTLVNGKYAKDNLKNIYQDLNNFYYMYQERNRNLFSVFDMFVFCTTPWEIYGYDIRERFRATLAAEFARTIYLTSLYYRINFPTNTKAQEDFSEIAEKLAEFLSMEGNEVVRREDAVCQMKGARLVIKNYASTDGQWCILHNGCYPFPSGQMTKEELGTIVTYYKNRGVSDNFTIIDCLNDGGLEISKEAVNNEKPKIVLSTTGFTYSNFFFGISSTDCTLKFSGYAKNVPVNSYGGPDYEISFPDTPVHDYCIFEMTGNFMVAPDGITRFKNFN